MKGVRVIQEGVIKELVGPAEALDAVRSAFAAYARKEATLPNPSDLDLPGGAGEMHVKGAYIHGEPYFSYKAASGFYANAAKGLSITSGINLVFSAETGFLEALLLDNGYLTDIRTGAAGALASDLLAKKGPARVGVIGAGGQAHFQLEALALVRPIVDVAIFSRTRSKADLLAEEMAKALDADVRAVESAQEAVEQRDIVITTTPSRSPVVFGEWLSDGTHITAMGADLPEKQELDPGVFERADLVVADDVDHASRSGDLHHALDAGVISKGDVMSLGDLVNHSVIGRKAESEITIADLTGLGIQDAAVANAALAAAIAGGAGHELDE